MVYILSSFEKPVFLYILILVSKWKLVNVKKKLKKKINFKSNKIYQDRTQKLYKKCK